VSTNLSPKLNEMFNAQVMNELRNSNIFAQCQAYCDENDLNRLAKYFKCQKREERRHADKFIHHLTNRVGGKVDIEMVEAPNVTINSTEDLIRVYLDTEAQTSQEICDIMTEVVKEGSYLDQPFVSKFLNIQVHEEEESHEFANKLKNCGNIYIFNEIFRK
jgi:ferritin